MYCAIHFIWLCELAYSLYYCGPAYNFFVGGYFYIAAFFVGGNFVCVIARVQVVKFVRSKMQALIQAAKQFRAWARQDAREGRDPSRCYRIARSLIRAARNS